MGSKLRISPAECIGWGLVAVALGALGALWHMDRTRVWESPRWDDAGLVLLRAAEPADSPAARRGGGSGAEREARGDGEAGAEREARGAVDRAPRPIETWAVAVNPRCELCRGSLARGLELRRAARAPVTLAALIVDTRQRPSAAAIEALGADELRWDSTGAWRHRWGHRVYGETLCFDRAGNFVRALAPLIDSLAARRAFRVAASLAREGGS